MTAVQEARHELHLAGDALLTASEVARKAKADYLAAIVDALSDENSPRRIDVAFSWDCPESPFDGVCVYDLDLDPGSDECIFCHEPKERK